MPWLPAVGDRGCRRAGRAHGHLVETGQVEAGQAQADEIRVTVRGGVVWQAMALDAASRLWLGGVVSRARDGALVTRLLERVRASVASWAILLFREGNGRTQREFIRRLALQAGLHVAWEEAPHEEMVQASITAMAGRLDLLEAIMGRMTTRVST